MDTKHFRQKLLEKERELLAQLPHLESETRDSVKPEVGDVIDEATADQAISESSEEETVISQTLEEVRDALQRIEDGTYGRCIACGREIEPARLEAVPWAAYCLKDQEKLDARGSREGSTL